MNSKIRNIIINTLMDYDPVQIGIFGSYAREEATKESDIDILVEFRTTLTLLQLAHLERILENRLGFRVDLVTKGSLRHPVVSENIRKDLKIIYQ